MSGHTKGPWLAEEESEGFSIVNRFIPAPDDSWCVATIHENQCATANANLIAAAPELLDELEEYSSHAREIIAALLAIGGRDNLLLADKINRRHPIRFKLIARAKGEK